MLLATLICPLEEEDYKMIENIHNDRLGHMGWNRLEKRTEDWPIRRRDLIRFVSESLVSEDIVQIETDFHGIV